MSFQSTKSRPFSAVLMIEGLPEVAKRLNRLMGGSVVGCVARAVGSGDGV